ncbi:hypothetical protein IV45_GL000048 [Limosilactobacillus secaliphilus]|uniref:Uncharacterized protein n=1 Tax=Limosilactobacillus secaliphilus TaxID=396268 RepID=A0A0R2I8S5_9LACO|nr:hypothetical protein IV45_GL000048 [Limosilactobacillus secaliphilus]
MTELSKHKITTDSNYFDSRYAGEDRDDNNANELSVQPDGGDEKRLSLLLTNWDADGHEFDNTFSLTKEEARLLGSLLTSWGQDER